MKKNLFSLILFAVLLSGCGNASETQEAVVETETIEFEEGTVATDSVTSTEIDNTTAGIEEASAEVDSLLNEI